MTINNRLEGNGAIRILSLMREEGHNVDVKFHVATVKSVSPFAIRIPGDNFDITDDLLIVSQALLPHEKQAKVDGGATVTIAFQVGYVNVNDEVIVVETNDGQRYIVLEKVGA